MKEDAGLSLWIPSMYSAPRSGLVAVSELLVSLAHPCPHVTELVEGGMEVSLVDLLPGGSTGWARGSGNGFFDDWYRLECELMVLYRLVPVAGAVEVVIGRRGSVIGGISASGEVGTVGDNKVIPEVKIKCGCGWCS